MLIIYIAELANCLQNFLLLHFQHQVFIFLQCYNRAPRALSVY